MKIALTLKMALIHGTLDGKHLPCFAHALLYLVILRAICGVVLSKVKKKVKSVFIYRLQLSALYSYAIVDCYTHVRGFQPYTAR